MTKAYSLSSTSKVYQQPFPLNRLQTKAEVDEGDQTWKVTGLYTTPNDPRLCFVACARGRQGLRLTCGRTLCTYLRQGTGLTALISSCAPFSVYTTVRAAAKDTSWGGGGGWRGCSVHGAHSVAVLGEREGGREKKTSVTARDLRGRLWKQSTDSSADSPLWLAGPYLIHGAINAWREKPSGRVAGCSHSCSLHTAGAHTLVITTSHALHSGKMKELIHHLSMQAISLTEEKVNIWKLTQFRPTFLITLKD